jgi:hypothetical protein
VRIDVESLEIKSTLIFGTVGFLIRRGHCIILRTMYNAQNAKVKYPHSFRH